MKAYHRAMGLCYKCNAKWSPNHKCALEVLHAVGTLWDSFSSEDSLADSSLGSASPEHLFLAVSKSAMTGALAARAVRLQGHLQDIRVGFLIDSDNSSPFINESLVPLLHNI